MCMVKEKYELLEKEAMERVGYIDSLRGFAILIVVVGHLIQFNYNAFLESKLFNIIYSFHMPLFFFISGCARALHIDKQIFLKSLFAKIFKRFYVLIVPSIVWSSIVPLFFFNITNITWRLTSSYWFLNVLFVISLMWECFLYLEMKCSQKTLLYITCLSAGLLLFYFDIKRIPIFYLMMFILGFYFQRYKWINKINIHVYGVLLILFLLFVSMFKYGSEVAGDPNRIWLLMPLSICASFCLIKLFETFDSKSYKITERLGSIGQFTLGIYLAHFIFVKIGGLSFVETHFDIVLQYIILSIIAIFISYLCVFLQHLLQPFGWLYSIMYGRLNGFNKIDR